MSMEGNMKKVTYLCSYSRSSSTGPQKQTDVLGNALSKHKSVPHPMGSQGTLALECDTGPCTGALGLASLHRQHGRQAAGCLEIQQNAYQNGVQELVAVQ